MQVVKSGSAALPLYCSGATFSVAVALLLLIERNGDCSAATSSLVFLALHATAAFELGQYMFWVSIIVFVGMNEMDGFKFRPK